MAKHLHIVCFDVPYPPDYGGVIEVFSRIKALYLQGIKIHLHCFDYGRGKQDELNEYCEEVNYYKRYRGVKGFSLRLPYIVSSRRNKALLRNLLKDAHPVLLEGIHCTFFLFTNQLKDKKVFVRLHNVESEYYRELAKYERENIKRLYFINESRLLMKYEKKIAGKAVFLAITQRDARIYNEYFVAAAIKYLPAFLPYHSVTAKEGNGSYCLYHGNLSIAENEKAAAWLFQNIFEKINIPFIIAGKNPSKELAVLIKGDQNTSLISNPSSGQMDQLISNAHINILPSFNVTGIKMKLMNALYNGRFCIVNRASIEGTGLEPLCRIAETEKEFSTHITQLFDQPFTAVEIEKRSRLLNKLYNNTTNVEMLIQWIY